MLWILDSDLTLIRLGFRIAPEQMDAFDLVYESRLMPVLDRCGFTPAQTSLRPMPEDVFARLFVIETSGELQQKRQVLAQDKEWCQALTELAMQFGNPMPDGLLFYALELYWMRSGSGRLVDSSESLGNWRMYDATRGLASGFVFSMLEDRDGRLWFSAFGGGVSCFDGQAFQTYTREDGLVHNEVFDILQDRKGFFWFATEGGVSRLDSSRTPEQAWQTFTVEDGLAHNEVSVVYEDREGLLWFGTEGGVSCFDGASFFTLNTSDGLANNSVLSILQDPNGHFWFATEGGVSRYHNGIFTTFTTREGLGDNWIRQVFCDRDGDLWFATNAGGVSRYDGEGFVTYTTDDGLMHNNVMCIYQDRSGVMWFSTLNGVNYLSEGSDFQTVSGLVSKRVWSILEDREGHLWFGTFGGVIQYEHCTFASYRADRADADDGIFTMLEDRDGRIWFAPFGGGVGYLDSDGLWVLTSEDGLADPTMMSVCQDKEGRMWFGLWDSGVCCYDPLDEQGATMTYFSELDGLAGNRVWRILQDHRDDTMWFGSWGGLARYDGHRLQKFTAADGLLHGRIRTMMQDRKGNIWLGSVSGVSYYDGDMFHTFGQQDNLPDKSIWSIYEDQQGNLWFGTMGSGVCRYDGEMVTRFTTADGLASNGIWCVLEDRDGCLWFCTNGGGVSLYDGQVFQTLTAADGLAGNVVQAILQDRNGDLWFGTNNGVTRYHRPVTRPPEVWVDGVIADRRYNAEELIVVPNSIALVAFEFHGMSFKTRPEAMVFRYRLKGLEEDWQITHQKRVEYEGLSVGSYVFEVQAVDRDLVYSEHVAQVVFEVMRDERDERIDELEARVQERTAQLVQVEKMSALGNMVAGLAHEINNPAGAMTGAMDVLSRGIARLRELIGDTDNPQLQRILKALKDSNQSALMASGRIARVVQNLRTFAHLDEAEYQKVDVHMGLDSTIELLLNDLAGRISIVKNYGDVPEVYCYPAELNQLFMNILTNAIQAIEGRGIIEITTRADGANLVIEISDTGRGMSPEVVARIFEPGYKAGRVRVGTGLGLSISANIAQKHSGRIDVTSEEGTGSTFVVCFPIRR